MEGVVMGPCVHPRVEKRKENTWEGEKGGVDKGETNNIWEDPWTWELCTLSRMVEDPYSNLDFKMLVVSHPKGVWGQVWNELDLLLVF